MSRFEEARPTTIGQTSLVNRVAAAFGHSRLQESSGYTRSLSSESAASRLGVAATREVLVEQAQATELE